MKKRTLKLLRNVLISVGVLLGLFVGGGVAYTWYVGSDGSGAVVPPPPTVPSSASTVHRPPKVAASAAESASIQMLTSPVAPGANASVTVQTNPGSVCDIKVVYNDTPSTDSGLVKKTADDYGQVIWTWTIEQTVPAGKWPVKITCLFNKKSAFVQGELAVATR